VVVGKTHRLERATHSSLRVYSLETGRAGGPPVSSSSCLDLSWKLNSSWSTVSSPGTMKKPDPTDDLDQTILETFDEMHAEAQITPIYLTFPPEVLESVEAYAREHSLEPATLIPLAIKAQENQSDKFSEAGERLMEDPDSASRRSSVLPSACLHAKACLSMCGKSA
jgi:hypothetical protein